jgi:ectoine hydroxylase-related dioxygenase (phytanoyl-CoA dioxygenase family)
MTTTTTAVDARRVFLDDQIEERFRREGYVVKRILSDDGVREVARLYEELRCDLKSGWHADLFSDNLEYRRRVHEEVGGFFERATKDLFDRYKVRATSFVVKEPMPETSGVPLHQDWTIIDQRRFRSINVVCPLVDTNDVNGWLMVVPGSHHPPCRISFAPVDKIGLNDVIEEIRAKYLRPLPMKAGEALIYDGRLLHGSPPNRSGSRRVAFSAGLIPEEADLVIYYRDPANPHQLEMLKVEDHFFWTHRLGTRPTPSTVLDVFPDSNPPITREHLERWSAAMRKSSSA